MNTLFTYGYTGGSVADLLAYVRAGAVIADVRLSPNSRVPQWRKEALEGVLGAEYHWVPNLGNVNYKTGGGIRIRNLRAGLVELGALLEDGPVVLLCACAFQYVDRCHRRIVAAEAARQFGFRVTDLQPGDRLPGC